LERLLRLKRPRTSGFAHLPEWAPGLGNAVECVGDEWFVTTPMGRVGFAFVPRNELGVLDHRVTLRSRIQQTYRRILTPEACAPPSSSGGGGNRTRARFN
jgi:hypothetical protein